MDGLDQMYQAGHGQQMNGTIMVVIYKKMDWTRGGVLYFNGKSI
jgi:hypothetical protein